MKLASQKDCTGCMACIDACSHAVLRAEIDKDGYFSIVKNTGKDCVECGRCTQICPVINHIKIEGKSNPYAAWNTNSEQRKQSASGGIFAAIATVVIRMGGSVYGASIDGFDVKHIRITDEKDLHLLQGSKYQHSNMEGVYKQVRNDLRQGMFVLFSGMGCQVAGLLSFLGKINKEKLFTIDTICGGLSTMLPMLHLKCSGKYIGIKSFRDKENGWQSTGFRYSLKMIRRNGNIEDLGLDNMVLNTFSSKLLKRSSCLDCKFTGFHRMSDCTIGDFWGDQRFKEQHAKGLSVLVVHTDKIKALMEDANMEIKPISWNELIINNHNIQWTHYPKIRHFFSRKKALNALRNNKYAIANRQINPWTLPGLFLRLYLKINKLQMRHALLPPPFRFVNNSRRLFSRILSKVSSHWLNPLYTVYFNFIFFPFRQAIHLPVFIYGWPRLYSQYGNMQCVGICKRGMVRINLTLPNAPQAAVGNTQLNIWGNVIFRGRCKIGTGCNLLVNEEGTLDIGDDVRIMTFVNITVYSKVRIGKHSRIVHRSQIMDSNYHCIADFTRNIVKNRTHPITIGDYCWICNSTTVSGGAVIPDKTIVASNSLVGKDMTSIPEESIIGGAPAKLIVTGFRRVENERLNNEIERFFRDNRNANYYTLPEGIEHSCCDADDDV